MAMDPVPLAVALGPLALYMLYLAGINLLRRPVLVSGAMNSAAVALSVSGFVVVGPMGLLLPEGAVNVFGAWVWLLMLGFYGLSVTLCILLSRPRLVIFNLSAEQLRPVLAEVVAKLDSEVRWAGDSLMLPHLGLQFHLEPYSPMRSLSLVSIGDRQSFAGWQRLEKDLRVALRQTEVSPNPRGFSFLTCGLLLLSWPIYLTIKDGTAVAQALREMFRM
ncbi:MAG: hypothetical protein SGJ20_14440 [Planctomycetota bacterium]|nr:hypothetical protein [Planctomycetota bacterium]